jgi:hypothetical protein
MKLSAPVLTIILLAIFVPASAQAGLGDLVRETSCQGLKSAGTVGAPDLTSPSSAQAAPSWWAGAPSGLLPPRVELRTPSESFNRFYEFGLRSGNLYSRRVASSDPWRSVPLPLCLAGRINSISADDDELLAIDSKRRVYTLDNVLKNPLLWNWSARWGTPVWLGSGYTLPSDVKKWTWSVVSPAEDEKWTDPAGNRTTVGLAKVSHIWGLRAGGQRLTFFDPWLPLDESYEACGPNRGRFKSVNISASGSKLFVIGEHGDMFTRFYDFDLSGHDQIFFRYSYENQRGKGDGAPIQLPAEPWVQQPKIPGIISSTISIHKIGKNSVNRVMRVEGMQGGKTGYWERDVANPESSGWSFHLTGRPLTSPLLDNPASDTSHLGEGASEDRRYVMSRNGADSELLDYNTYCSPARLRIREGGTTRDFTLHSVDGLRQWTISRDLNSVPRQQWAALEDAGGKFQTVTVLATKQSIQIPERGWEFKLSGN